MTTKNIKGVHNDGNVLFKEKNSILIMLWNLKFKKP